MWVEARASTHIPLAPLFISIPIFIACLEVCSLHYFVLE